MSIMSVPVVASGDDDVTRSGGRAVGDARRDGAEIAAFATGALDGFVEQGEVLVGLRGDRDGSSCRVMLDPSPGDVVEHRRQVAGVDAAVLEIRVERLGACLPKLERGGLFPTVAEPVDGDELVDAVGSAEFVEHAAAPDRMELAGVADENERPPLRFGEGHEPLERARPDMPASSTTTVVAAASR